jgi:VIT1/CCC1 family predicted Fe2+/Mn2+ transporter
MITEEHGLPLETPSPVRAAWTTFVSFAAAGLIPLVPFVFFDRADETRVFVGSAMATLSTFLVIGVVQGHLVGKSKRAAALEALAIGTSAAGLAYGVGWALRQWASV